MPQASEAEITQRALDRYELARNGLNEFSQVHSVLADYCRPTNESAGRGPIRSNHPSTNKTTRLFDTTAALSVQKHASGIKSWMSPAQNHWFDLLPPDEFADDEECISWYAKCTAVLEKLLARSMFHSEDHECILDGAAFGIRCLYADINEKTGMLIAQQWEPGTFAVLENSEGMVDSIFREKNFTARQALEKFGEAALPETTVKEAKEASKSGNKRLYVHCIYPRIDAERDGNFSMLAENMPIASVWIDVDAKKIVRNSGFDEMPAPASRYLKWGDTVYGTSAALIALADARQLNKLQERLDIKIDKLVNPALLVPDEMDEDEVNLAPGGITFYRDPQRIPRPLDMLASNGQEEMLRVNMRKDSIRDAFCLNIFEAVTRKTKEMTALEAQLVSQEAIDLFSPMFTRMTGEHYGPILNRYFNLLLRRSEIARSIGDTANIAFPEIPKKLIRIVGNAAEIPPPVVNYTSRIALALKQIHSSALRNSISRRMEIGQVIGAAAFDDLNLPKALKTVDRSEGLPEDFFRSPEEVDAIVSNREQMQAMQAQAAAAKDASTAVKNVKGTPAEALIA